MGAQALSRPAAALLLAAALLPGAAAPAAGADGPGGTVQVRVHDHRDALADFARLELAVASVQIHPRGAPRGAGWVSIPARGEPVDLTRFVGPPGAVVAEGPAPAGAYDAVRLGAAPLAGALTTGAPATATPPIGGVALRFQVRPGERTVLLVDLTVQEMSDHPGGGYAAHIRSAGVAAP